MRGKSLGRILLNWEIKKRLASLRGEVLDLASGGGASYDRYLPAELKVIKTDYHKIAGTEALVDINGTLPFADNSQENIFLFGALYIVSDIGHTLGELRRIKKPSGMIFVSLPFVAGEMPEPHDYFRLTGEGLVQALSRAGLDDFEIIRVGGRFSAAANLLHSFYYFNSLRLIAYAVALGLDRLFVRWEKKHPCPILYFCIIGNRKF